MPIVLRAQPMVLLTERTAHLSTHSGQVAFPGGRTDPEDRDAAATALREALRAAGFNAFTDTVSTDGGKRTRVSVGPTMTRAEADTLRARVSAKAGVDGYVRSHP